MLALFLPQKVARRVKVAALLFLLLAALGVRSCVEPAAPPHVCVGPGPRQSWRGFNGPAYLPYRLARPPKQRVLDSLARAARRRRA